MRRRTPAGHAGGAADHAEADVLGHEIGQLAVDGPLEQGHEEGDLGLGRCQFSEENA